jgi:hypothetical protein
VAVTISFFPLHFYISSIYPLQTLSLLPLIYDNIGNLWFYRVGKFKSPAVACTLPNILTTSTLPCLPLTTSILNPFKQPIPATDSSKNDALRSQSPRSCRPYLPKHSRNSKVLQVDGHEARSISFVERCTRSRKVYILPNNTPH